MNYNVDMKHRLLHTIDTMFGVYSIYAHTKDFLETP